MCQSRKIGSIEEFVKETKKDYKNWGLGESPWYPWFRGEPSCDTPLLPKLYRKKYQDDYFENRLLQHFRTRAMAYGETPHRDETDMWLFLARHAGLPTRLLDWTESSLVALYFALQENTPIVWMLNPFRLNDMAAGKNHDKLEYNIYGLTWYTPEGYVNIASANINAAWQDGKGGIDLPVAIAPTYVHPRIPAQRSRFTVHGNKDKSLCEILTGEGVLQKYVIDSSKSREMLEELKILGISHSSLFPDLDGLAKDLVELFRPDLAEDKK